MAPINFQSLSNEEKQNFLNSFDTVVTDCDGVIWDPRGVINKAHEAVNKLSEQGKSFYFLTNNSTRTREQFLSKFQDMGFTNIKSDTILSTAALTATYLKEKLPPGKLVYVIGSTAICEELKKCNIESFGPGEDIMKPEIMNNISTTSIEICDNVGAVVVGYDILISYLKIIKAATYLKDKNCLFVATNTDETFPSGCPYVFPGTGTLVAAVKVPTGREPFVIGKPSTYLAEVLNDMKIDPKRTLFIGDRLNTDIIIGKKCNYKTLLVLTGVHNLDDVERYGKSENAEERMGVPDFYTSCIYDLCF